MKNQMNSSLPDERSLDQIERHAFAWVRQVASGKMTHADGAALKRWCAADPSHGAAFLNARRLWVQLGKASELVVARTPSAMQVQNELRPREKNWTRRAFLGTALGATAAATAVVVVHPPLGLWPSMGELNADYRTATGEQRRVALAENVNIELNTRTSIAVGATQAGVSGIELIAGEAAIDMRHGPGAFVVTAGAGKTSTQEAVFEVRRDADNVCVTCMRGRVLVKHVTGSMTLMARQQMTYDDKKLGPIVSVDAASVSAWREGSLRFNETPLAEVIEEINRYRPGRVILLDKKMAGKAVTGRFRIDALDKAIAQIQRSLDLNVRTLPGRMILLS